MRKGKFASFLSFFLLAAVYSGAQEHNGVPLDHAAYGIIEIAIMQGIILPPPSVKPWPLHMVKQKLWEIIEDPLQVLSSKEIDTAVSVLDSLERKAGFEPKEGRYRAESGDLTFEAGIGWESIFSVETEGAIASTNLARIYSGGDLAHSVSWNINAQGGLFYIDRNELGTPAAFPYSFGKQWDGGVLSLGESDGPFLAYGAEGELNGVFFDRLLQLRLGRIRHNWSYGSGSSLFLSSHARPFAAFEGVASPLSWLNISFLGGALENVRTFEQAHEAPFTNILTAAQVEFNLAMFVHFSFGGAAVLLDQPDAAFFANLELRLPGLFSLWGRLFVDRLDSDSENFFLMNGNSYAYQVGLRTIIHWLPFATFTLRYTKIEPYCYSAFINDGESLGYYLPPNSDELLLRLESMLFPDIDAHVQFQMIRHGADYGYGAVGGSSLYDRLDYSRSAKYFLMDGVYRWDNILKLGGSINLKTSGVPLSFFAETGLVMTTFTINGDAGVGNEADYESLNDEVYRGNTSFIFSIGFRLFP